MPPPEPTWGRAPRRLVEFPRPRLNLFSSGRLLLAGLLVALLAPFAPAASPARPNLVFILADDLGWGDLPSYGGTAKMPNLERLAAEGVRFTQAYASSPICSPSRTGFLTGQFPARHRITSFLHHRIGNQARGMPDWLDLSAPSLPRGLQRHGYYTAQSGKWHLGGQRDVGDAPLVQAYGFDSVLTNFEGLGPRLLPLMDAFDGRPPKKSSLGSARLGKGPITWTTRAVITEAYARDALKAIDAATRAQKPFYLQVWLDDPHIPLFPPKDKRGDGSPDALYRGVLEAMDAQLAPLLARLRDDPALRANTLVIFASDNGPDPSVGSSGGLRGVKGTLYEGGIRIPLVTWGPGLLPASAAGTVNTTTVFAGTDLAPSLLALAGATPADDFDGEDLSSALLGRSPPLRTRPLFWIRPPRLKSAPGVPEADLALRDGDWKLLLQEDGSDPRLHHLGDDPRETNNLAAADPARVARMKQRLLAWRATLPVPPLGGVIEAPPFADD